MNPYETDVACQTELYLERPLTPPFVPTKTGVDVAIQVNLEQPDNFDLDRELKLVIDDCVARAVVEVAQDKVDQESRSLEQTPRDASSAAGKEKRQSAANILQGYVADLLPSILNSIKSIREAENNAELKKQLAPWLAQEISQEVGQIIDSRELLKELVKEILQERAELYVAGDGRVAADKINLFEDDTFDSEKNSGKAAAQFPEKIENVLSRNVELLEKMERPVQSISIPHLGLVSKSSTTTSDQVESLESDEVVEGGVNPMISDDTIEEESESGLKDEVVELDILESQVIQETNQNAEKIGLADGSQDTSSTIGDQESAVVPNFNIEITPKSPITAAKEQDVEESVKEDDSKDSEGYQGEEVVQSADTQDVNEEKDEENIIVLSPDIGEIQDTTGEETGDDGKDVVQGDDRDEIQDTAEEITIADEKDVEVANSTDEDKENKEDITTVDENNVEQKNTTINVDLNQVTADTSTREIASPEIREEALQNEEVVPGNFSDPLEVNQMTAENEESMVFKSEEVEVVLTDDKVEIIINEKDAANENNVISDVIKDVKLPDVDIVDTESKNLIPSPSKSEIPENSDLENPIPIPEKSNENVDDTTETELKVADCPAIIISSSRSSVDNSAMPSITPGLIESARIETPNLDSISYPDDDLFDLMDDNNVKVNEQRIPSKSSPEASSITTNDEAINSEEKESTFEIIEGAEVLTIKSARKSVEEVDTIAQNNDCDPIEETKDEDKVEVTEVCTRKSISALTSPDSDPKDQVEMDEVEKSPESKEMVEVVEPEMVVSTPEVALQSSPTINSSTPEPTSPLKNVVRDVKTPTAPPMEIPEENEEAIIKDIIIETIENQILPETPNEVPTNCEDMDLYKPVTSGDDSIPNDAVIPCEDMVIFIPTTEESSYSTDKQVKEESEEPPLNIAAISPSSTSPLPFKADEQDNVSLLNAFCSDLNLDHVPSREDSPKAKPRKNLMISFDEGERAEVAFFVDEIEQTAKSIVASPMELSSFIYDTTKEKVEEVQEEVKSTTLSVTEEIRRDMAAFVEKIQKDAEFVLSKPQSLLEAFNDDESLSTIETETATEATSVVTADEQPRDNQLNCSQGQDEVDHLTLLSPHSHPPPLLSATALNYDSEMEMDSLEVTLAEADDNDDVMLYHDSIEDNVRDAINTDQALVQKESLTQTESETETTAIEMPGSAGQDTLDEDTDQTVRSKSAELKRDSISAEDEEDHDKDVVIISTKDGKL